MKTPKYALTAALVLATGLLVACGDDKPAASDAELVCVKLRRMGGKSPACGDTDSASGSSTATTTSTVTVTVNSTTTTTQ